ncbi:hypothetical protein [Streptomyces sp. NPDC086519]|uniref:hypothetical protein n=1 Tax=Streptomyces sp. NPDC086519 TaxID=3154863 RepID=UPI00342DFB17
MSGKTWEPTKKGARDLNNFIRKGTTVYTKRTMAKLSPVPRPEQHYAAHTFDWRSPITGHWMTGHLSAAQLLAQEGTVYENQPDLYEIGYDGPGVSGPLGDGYEGVLDEAEIGGLWKQVRDGSNPRTRRPANSWRI